MSSAEPPRATPSRASTAHVLLRYVAFQLPALVVLGAVVFAVHRWLGLSATLAWTVVALWVAKDAALFPYTRHAYDPGDGSFEPLPRESPAIAKDGLAAEYGHVMIGPERWRARRVSSCPAIRPGERVRIIAVEGLTVVVDRHEG